jgi:ATP-dependent Lon protease
MVNFLLSDDHAERIADIPKEIPILPLRNTVVYPFSVVPLTVGIPRSIKLIEDALEGDRLVGLLAMKDPSIEEPQPEQIYEIGSVAKVYRVVKAPDNTMQVIVQGLERFRVEKWLGTDPYLRAQIGLIPDVVEPGLELDALQRSLRELAQEIVSLSPNLPEEVGKLLDQVHDPRYLTYLVAANAQLKVTEAQKILEFDNIKDKLRALISHLTHEKEVLSLGQKIQTEAREEMDKAQREYYLRQQLRAIQKELGEKEEGQSAFAEYTEKIEKSDMPEEAKKEAQRELKRLEGMPAQAAEYSVIKTYLDWLLDLPWNVLSEDQLDIEHARTVLDEDHYDLQEVKDRIIEYLGVRKLVRERGLQTEPGEEAAAGEAKGAILCFVGPPGVGKTSLGQSIARSLGRKFTRMSLGGMRDEAEIRGHRRTYIGAMPGRIIQAIKRAGTRNPVFMLDEVDKIGNDWRGDPSSALLEVLDPAQNHGFRDHYLDVNFDLSDVIFITTANQLETVPPALRDRMEIIHLDGYTEYEKLKIAQRYLVPRQVKANGLHPEEVTFSEEALNKIIQDYTRESGVRTLERQIGTICRKSAVKIASGELNHISVSPEIVREDLKKERFESESSEAIEIPGIATGLSVTAVGGDILFIEATRMKGKGELTLTGQLGDVMRESAQIAHSYVRSKSGQLGIDPKVFEKTDVHVHVPAGAIPKDGPSAGVTMLMAMASLFSGRPVRGDVGMTGEVTLRGRMLPVGGIKMKVLAAHRAGLKTVILPKRNERDLEDVPEDVRMAIRFIPIEWIDEALDVALVPPEGEVGFPGAIADEGLMRQPKVSLN